MRECKKIDAHVCELLNVLLRYVVTVGVIEQKQRLVAGGKGRQAEGKQREPINIRARIQRTCTWCLMYSSLSSFFRPPGSCSTTCFWRTWIKRLLVMNPAFVYANFVPSTASFRASIGTVVFPVVGLVKRTTGGKAAFRTCVWEWHIGRNVRAHHGLRRSAAPPPSMNHTYQVNNANQRHVGGGLRDKAHD